MIVYPIDWKNRGKNPERMEIDDLMIQILRELDCRNLSLSGGIDSSLMLWYMVQAFGSGGVSCFNVASSAKHPDYLFSDLMARCLKVDCHHFIPDEKETEKGKVAALFPGDEIVKIFYENLGSFYHIDSIIACDGIDEITGGYYDHANNPTDETFFGYLQRLQREQLEPLNKNSGNIKVFLPYMDYRFISLMSFIPTWEKFGLGYRKKVICDLAKGKVPDEIINRRKYGFVDAMRIKGVVNEISR